MAALTSRHKSRATEVRVIPAPVTKEHKPRDYKVLCALRIPHPVRIQSCRRTFRARELRQLSLRRGG